MADIIVSGHLCLDLFPRMGSVSLQTLTTPGRLIEVGQIDVSTGGAVANTGLALHRLGINVQLMTAVGDDLSGQIILNYLNSRDPKLGDGITILPGQPSSYTIVLSPQGTDRSFLHCTGTNSTFDIGNLDFAVIREARIFHLGYPPLLPRLITDHGSGLRGLFKRAKETGVITSLDMVLPDPQSLSGQVDWWRILRNTLPYVDIFLPSIEEIVFMLRRQDYDQWHGDILPHLTAYYLNQLAGELLEMGVVIGGFKLGEYGIYLRTSSDAAQFKRLKRAAFDPHYWQNKTIWMPAFQVDVAGTTGAGDAAYAGFFTAMLHGNGPFEAVQWACAVGACCVEAVDSHSGVQTREQTEFRLATDWPIRSERLAGW
jgi:sugar/nucleoside kinase (ribokinase family)